MHSCKKFCRANLLAESDYKINITCISKIKLLCAYLLMLFIRLWSVLYCKFVCCYGSWCGKLTSWWTPRRQSGRTSSTWLRYKWTRGARSWPSSRDKWSSKAWRYRCCSVINVHQINNQWPVAAVQTFNKILNFWIRPNGSFRSCLHCSRTRELFWSTTRSFKFLRLVNECLWIMVRVIVGVTQCKITAWVTRGNL